MDSKALYRIGYGVYIIGAKKGNKINAQIANTISQIASEPPTVAVSINKKNLTHEYIHESQAFSASILNNETPLAFIGIFGFKSGRDGNKFEGINYKTGATGAPVVLDHAVSYLEVKVNQEVDAGTHTLFIGQVVEAEVLSDKPTLTYEYYQQVKRGTTPKGAPSYQEPKKEVKAAPKMAKYKCSICGYIYDPSLGDPDSGIKAGTSFEDLPANWTCPLCGAEKSNFEKME
ncbi:MAG TPA: flavin reductase [Dehalococcoidales bacterium]|nr:flavin reductase [Dehalococcoidales bacterium]